MVQCINILLSILSLYNIFLIGHIILTWLPFLMKYSFFRLIYKIGGWYIEPFSGVLVLGPIDFTPVIGFIIYDSLIAAIYYLL